MSLEEEFKQKFLEVCEKLSPEKQIHFEIWMHAYMGMLSHFDGQVSRNKITKYINGEKKEFIQYEILTDWEDKHG